jgi:hypothetical protein
MKEKQIGRNDNMPATMPTEDLETLALSQNERFWRMLDAAYERGEKEGWIALEDLD